jgi:hypothetical protein
MHMTRGGEVTITDSNSDPDGREGRTSARIRRPMKQAAPPSQRTQTAAADDGAATRSHRQIRTTSAGGMADWTVFRSSPDWSLDRP